MVLFASLLKDNVPANCYEQKHVGEISSLSIESDSSCVMSTVQNVALGHMLVEAMHGQQ